MHLLIGRLSASTDRVFPPITASLYRSTEPPPNLTPDQQAAWKLLLLGQKSGSWRYWLPGFKPNAMKKLELLLHCHRRAIEAELASKWNQADFFWGWLHKELKLLSGDKYFWKVIANQASQIADVAILTDPEWLRVRFITEIIIDTHSAFYNFYISFREARALRHFDDLLALTGLVRLPLEDKKLLLGPPLDKYLTQRQQKEQTRKALDVCKQLLQFFPDHVPYQDTLAKLQVADMVGRLPKNEKDEDAQPPGLPTFEAAPETHPLSPPAFWAYWLLHPRLRLLKFATFFLIIGGGWYLIAGLTTGYIRNNAYQQLAAANESRNYQAIFEQADRFLENQPPFSKDNRTGEVTERYTEAFVRWFAQLEDVNGEAVETHVENYQRLVLQIEAE